MDGKRVFGSCLHRPKVEGDSFYPMYFGISCALFALEGISEKRMDEEKWLDVRSKMLQGSAQLLGLFIWRVQREKANSSKNYELLHKLEAAEKDIQQLKKMRSEDARANEKVVGIFAAQEQRWFSERKNLRQHVSSLLKDLTIFERRKHEESIELNSKLQEMEITVKSKNSALEEEGKKKKDLEERLKTLETQVEELREASKHEAKAHASELLKHKSAFIEVVSSQRHIEAELGRALRQVEIAKQQLDFVFEEKEESMFMVQNLSIELENVMKDSEQKDKILSAMLRKSKLDTAEKHMLLKEAKLSKALMKQVETEKWRMASESRNERHTFRSMLTKQVSSRLGGNRGGNSAAPKNAKSQPNDCALDLVNLGMESAAFSPQSHADGLPERDNELELSTDVLHLDSCERLQTGKYQASMEQRHQLELEAFSEQIRLKDEKLEAYHWRLLSMELESKRSTSQIEGLNKSISQLRHNKLKLETLLVERETELKALQDQIATHLNSLNKQRNKFHSSKIIKRKQVDKEEEAKKNTVEGEETESVSNDASDFTPQSLVTDTQGSKEVHEELVHVNEEMTNYVGNILQKESTSQYLIKKERSLWKMDIHALGISYKIKRLQQQLLMLERLAGKQGNTISGESEDQGQIGMKDFLLLLALLNKQATRYHSLQEKTDDMCKRMHEKDLNINQGDSISTRTKEDSRTLEHFLEETFQLQRFIVATGQKLMEIQSKIATGLTAVAANLDGSSSFDMKRFSDNIQSLFREVQRGIEVRIARIIGDVGGTLACDGFRSRGH